MEPDEQNEIRGKGRGTLYVVSTPIGNLEDITLRALKVLEQVDLIAAESVNHTRGLCRHYGIRTKIIRYNQHNQRSRGPLLIDKLKNGEDIALLTNAGTPGVSDPGVALTAQALEEGLRVSPVPGPSSITAALSVSGLRGDKFLFMGFPPNRSNKRKTEFRGLASEGRTLVFFEAPHRLREMLVDLKAVLGDRRIVLAREMTKIHEEIMTGTVSEVLERLDEDRVKGECTIVVSGTEVFRPESIQDPGIGEKIHRMMKKGEGSLRDIAERIAREEGLPYRRVYRACLANKRETERK
ncbi:MAG: 16S rRNA (cytidine(1402)-2'-O)-methyltransferase [Deltaproteobacteria bacterium]|nr:16S rRNA (cytidine(1402)-2'-O)-methyltransferase [Deltaproteobacteria bacterium]MBW2016725.1 16S rRNA (cytidine(1402)-2'-O)-methyltransferase [Deltaproteobacteria bacterium]MBW2128830.1 16S rRNA (cytidine(1402)-2'-O)-methyltransferase [Deltaproteobacteria bacterium]MBW2302231.1 16S rRNA (cytidine(1402)-2'-O)-methyltransferase [Deltaproteobacteria bacterium]